MDFAAFFDAALRLIETHRAWAGVIYGLMAFGESLVIVGVLIPATGVMMATGALVGAGTVPFLDVWIGGAIGAAAGDTVSYWVGRKLGPGVDRLWPFSRHPETLAAARNVFAHWGWMAVVVGRFIGPLRASVPTVAGITAMRHGVFQAANIGSAIVWIPVLIFPGSMGAIAWDLFDRGDSVTGTIVTIVALAGIVAALWVLRRWMPRKMK
ncbi:DedA family protein [Pinisolibacter sp.]|uniref:DedA family protein n=1 Tax=Pinisolibacter sp. TaxID=2172024 RepID=UPI002FDD1E03